MEATATAPLSLHPVLAEVEARAAGQVPHVAYGAGSGTAVGRAAKRTIDILGALTGLLLTLPVLLLIAVAVRIEGGPGVIFRQQRVGQHGRVFTLYKLRSLKPVADEGDVRWNIDNDARLGKVGKFIRRTSLDELPQLFNVLVGDMSLVGPRPERPFFVDQFSQEIPGYALRHRVPVGLTGLAVVKGLRGDTSIPERARVDNEYADNWSLWLDIKIMFRTVGYLISH
ncbi:sugar transferase [Pseudonocardia sp. CA-107938]|uniref:sugar transferase n=1 Tax=Pseudonocardia sp. CA-107938 TaxID=3240021 RepID=UPI003D8E3E00